MKKVIIKRKIFINLIMHYNYIGRNDIIIINLKDLLDVQLIRGSDFFSEMLMNENKGHY